MRIESGQTETVLPIILAAGTFFGRAIKNEHKAKIIINKYQ